MTKVIVGLPAASRGPMSDMARTLGAPVMLSASALCRWEDQGPVPQGYEFNAMERAIRLQTGDRRPPSDAQRRRRMKRWIGWNTAALDRISDLEVYLDSAGFVAMSVHGGHLWSCESYVLDLATSPVVKSFSSMDLCVEPELASDAHAVRERISKTIRLNRECSRLAREAGIHHKLMPVVQGWTADQYVRCFDEISGCVAPGATIGIGSMCRRDTNGPDGAIAILERLDAHVPADVTFHLFGIKNQAAEAAASIFGARIASIDSQAYGVRARRIANDRRAVEPSFSKSNAFTAEIMREWYERQSRILANPRGRAMQPMMQFGAREAPGMVIDALETIARAQINNLIEMGDLDHDQIIGGRMLEEVIGELACELPGDVRMTDRWTGAEQLPEAIRMEPWFPMELDYSPS